MTAMNRMFLVCTHHPTQRDSYLIAGRNRRGYDNLIEDEDGYFSKWLIKHAACGGGFDHFSLAFERPKDHDIPIDKPLANAVHLQLITSGERLGLTELPEHLRE